LRHEETATLPYGLDDAFGDEAIDLEIAVVMLPQ
jgi:hypothetical protein